MSDEQFTVSTKVICPLMADVMNAMIAADMILDDRAVAIAVAALGTALVQEQGMDPSDQDMIEALDMLAHHFSVAVERKYGEAGHD